MESTTFPGMCAQTNETKTNPKNSNVFHRILLESIACQDSSKMILRAIHADKTKIKTMRTQVMPPGKTKTLSKGIISTKRKKPTTGRKNSPAAINTPKIIKKILLNISNSITSEIYSNLTEQIVEINCLIGILLTFFFI